MKIQIVLLLTILFSAKTLSAHAYTDHRNRKVDSLENVLRTNKPKDKIELIRIYSDLAWGYLNIDGNKAIHYSDLGIPLCEEVGGYLKLNDFHRIKGMVNWGGANYKEAEKELNLANDAVKMMRKSGKYSDEDVDDQESSLCGTLGNLYNTLGDGAKALKYYHKALVIFEKYDWKQSQAIAYHNMAELYYNMGNINHALDYYSRCDSVSILSKDSAMIAMSSKGKAKTYLSKGDYNNAKKCIKISHDYLFSHIDEEGVACSECLVVMADIAIAEDNWDEAEKLILQNEELGKRFNHNDAGFYSQRAELDAHKGMWKLAEQNALKALDINIEAPDMARETFKLLSEIYAHLGEPDKAKIYANKADSVQTAWSNYAYQASLTEQEMRFETEKKDNAIASLTNEKIGMIIIIVIASILLIGLIVASVIMVRRHKKQEEEIASQVAKETEKRERQIFAKDLHDGLGGLLSLLKLKIANNDKDAAIQLVDESTREMRRVAHHIMPEELEKKGLVTSLSNFAISVPGAQFHCLSMDEEKQEVPRLPKDIELVLYRCAYELVNNAIKHAFAKQIDIQLMIEDTQVLLTVCDNGKGISQEEKESGMGFQNLQERINEFNGKMEVISAPEFGTEINIVLPI